MAKKKDKPLEFDPNPFDGFRATTREGDGKVWVYMSMTGKGQTLEDVPVAMFPNTVQGRGKADVAFLLTQALAIAFNAAVPIGDIEDLMRAVCKIGEKYQVQLPKDWYFLTTAGIVIDNYQMIYAKEGQKEVVVVEPDEVTGVTTLADIVFEGRQNIVAPGTQKEMAKLRHQPNRRQAKGDKRGSRTS